MRYSWLKYISGFHRNELGSLSILSVFAILFLTMVLGMVINIGRHANRKVRLQNGADAATFSGSSMVARGMNTLVFTNHLLCDVFAVTAYLRESRDGNALRRYPEVLSQWRETAADFENAPPKFRPLANGILKKIPAEQAFVEVFGKQNEAISEQLLPVMEDILDRELIPEFQRALVTSIPRLANEAANEIAGRHSPARRGRYNPEKIVGGMWRTDAKPFGVVTADGLAQLPVSDPVYDSTELQPEYFRRAVDERRRYSFFYLEKLNNEMMRRVDGSIAEWGENGVAKMSQFGNLWRGFTRAYLTELLEQEFPSRNLVYQIRIETFENSDPQYYIEKDFMFVGVVYEKKMLEHMPGLFTNPLNADSVAFAQCRMDIPKPRVMESLERRYGDQFSRVGNHTYRTLMNQVWTVNLVPATHASIHEILLSEPPDPTIKIPDISHLSVSDFRQINHH